LSLEANLELKRLILQLYASADLGRTWKLVYVMVNPRFFWSVPNIDSSDSIVHLEAEDTATGIYMSLQHFFLVNTKCVCCGYSGTCISQCDYYQT